MKNKDYLLLGALGLGAYFLVIKPMQQTGQTINDVVSSPSNAIKQIQDSLNNAVSGATQATGSAFGGTEQAVSNAVSQIYASAPVAVTDVQKGISVAVSQAMALNPFTAVPSAGISLGNSLINAINKAKQGTQAIPQTTTITTTSSGTFQNPLTTQKLFGTISNPLYQSSGAIYSGVNQNSSKAPSAVPSTAKVPSASNTPSKSTYTSGQGWSAVRF